MTRRIAAATVFALAVLGGCATTQDVQVAKTPPAGAVSTAAHATDDGNSPEMDAILAAALQGEGISVTNALPAGTRQSPGVDVVVSYVDVWRWDLSMYLQSISIRLFDARSGDLLVAGNWKDSDLHGFRDPQLVVNGLVAEMLTKLRGGAPAGATVTAVAVATPSAPPQASPSAADASPQPAAGSVNEWVSVEGTAELRTIYSDTTHRGRVYGRNTAQGTPYVGQYRSNGTGFVEFKGRRYARTWSIRGSNMACGRTGQTTDCYRLQRNRVNPNEYRGRHVSRDLSVQFTVEPLNAP
jgi:hypothetical protein